MKSILKTATSAILALGLSTGAGFSENLALVIENRDYANGADASAGQFDALVAAYEAAGYTVTKGQNMSRSQLYTLLNGFQDAAADADRLVLHLNGHVVNSGQENWYLPADANVDSLMRVAFTAPTLDLFLSLAARNEGRAVVFVGTQTPDSYDTAGLEAGLGRLNVPTGVLMLHGPAVQVSTVARSRALVPGASLRDAVRDLPSSVTRIGFASPDAVLVDLSDDLGDAPLTPSTASQPTEPAVDPAEAAETALNLNRDARRTIQENLVVLGYNTRGIDGIFGRGSRGAITEWQTKEGLTQTGFLTEGQVSLLAVQASNRKAEIEAENARRRAEQEQEDRAFWRSTGEQNGEEGIREYLRNYPNGLFAEQANARIVEIEAAQRAAASAEVQAAWQRAQDLNTLDGYNAFIRDYGNSEFVATAADRRARLVEQSNRVDTSAAEIENQLGLNGANRTLVQLRLASLGYNVGIGGSFDANTREAIAQFQRQYGLEATGYLNDATVRQLIVLGN